jgi:YVTN family beta-propeller protein
VQELAIDPNTGYLYAAHSAPNDTYPDNISIMKDSQFVTSFKTGVRSQDVAVNPNYGLAYIANPENDTMTIIQGVGIYGTYNVGDNPWSLDVNPQTGRVYVANRGENTISVFDIVTNVGKIPSGNEPFTVAVDAQRDLAYVTNRTSHIQCNPLGQCETVCDPGASVSVVR